MKKLTFLLAIAAAAALGQDYANDPDPNKLGALELAIPHTLAACDHSPTNSGQFTTALTNATAGQTICLQSGTTYSGNFVLPVKAGSSYITIRPTLASQLPPPGNRVSPADAPKMAKVVSATNGPGIWLHPGVGAGRWRLVGLEITTASSEHADLVRLGTNETRTPGFGPTQATVDRIPQGIILDRCYIHGLPVPARTTTGVQVNADYVAIINTDIRDIHDGDGDNHTINVVNAQGPFIFRNNKLEAAGENILFGGADPGIQLVPSDALIEGNWLWKNPAYRNILLYPAYKAKNLFELKTGKRIKIRGNVLENFWSGVQSQYFAFVGKTANQGAVCRWDNGSYNQTADIIFEYNKLINIAQGFVFGRLAACDKTYNGSERFYVHDNLIVGLGSGHTQDGAPKISIWSYPQRESGGEYVYPRNVVFAHNTVATPVGFGLQQIRYTHLETQGNYVRDFYFHSNILPGRWFAAGTYNAAATILDRFRSALVVKNNLAIAQSAAVFPTNPNFSRANYAGLFVNEAGGDYRLTDTNAALYPGMDGRPAGADIVALNACTSGATTSWTGMCPGSTSGSTGCPSQAVILSKSSIPLGSNSVVKAPDGWYGGVFTSSDTGKATIHKHLSTLWSMATGVAAGSTAITGTGWTAPNGATNCSLSSTSLAVTSVTSPKEVLWFDWNGAVQNSNPYTYAERTPGTDLQPQPVRANFDWTASPNFAGGTAYVRAVVGCMTNQFGYDAFRLLFNNWQNFGTSDQAETNIPASTPGLNFNFTGAQITNTFTIPLSSFDTYSPGSNGTPWSWAVPRSRVGFFTYPASVYGSTLPANVILDDHVYPFDMRLTVVNVAPGGTFSGWDTWKDHGLGERTYDCSYPTPVTITAPENGGAITGPVDITVNAQDNRGVTKVDYFIDEGPGSLKASDNLAPYSWRWDPSGYSTGAHTITVRAWDLAGNSNSHSIGVTVQRGPGLSVRLEANGSTTPIRVASGGAVKLEWFVTGATACEARASTPYGAGLWNGVKSTSGGSSVINPTASSTYYLDCTNGSSSASSGVQVKVAAVCAQPPL